MIMEMEMGLSATKGSNTVPAGDAKAPAEFSDPYRLPSTSAIVKRRASLTAAAQLALQPAPEVEDALDGDSQEDGNEDFQPGRAVEPLPDVQDLQRRLETLGTCTGKDLPEMKVMVSVQA